MGSPRRASRMGLQEGSPSPKRRPRRLDVENMENSPEPRAETPARRALGDVTPGHNAQANTSSESLLATFIRASGVCKPGSMIRRWQIQGGSSQCKNSLAPHDVWRIHFLG